MTAQEPVGVDRTPMRAVKGAAAGFAATVPMTAVMEGLFKFLPLRDRRRLPPREITMRVARRIGLRPHLDTHAERTAATLAAHFGYGSAAGILFAELGPLVPVPPVAAGITYGLLVWAASYLGLLPALGLLPPATEESPRRNALMIAAHLVWGASLGAITGLMFDKRH